MVYISFSQISISAIDWARIILFSDSFCHCFVLTLPSSRNLSGYFFVFIKIIFSRNQAFLVLFSLLLFSAVLVILKFYFNSVIIYFRLVSVVLERALLFTEQENVYFFFLLVVGLEFFEFSLVWFDCLCVNYVSLLLC